MVSGCVRLAGIVLSIWSTWKLLTGIPGVFTRAGDPNWPLWLVALPGGLLLFAAGRILQDLFPGRTKVHVTIAPPQLPAPQKKTAAARPATPQAENPDWLDGCK